MLSERIQRPYLHGVLTTFARDPGHDGLRLDIHPSSIWPRLAALPEWVRSSQVDRRNSRECFCCVTTRDPAEAHQWQLLPGAGRWLRQRLFQRVFAGGVHARWRHDVPDCRDPGDNDAGAWLLATAAVPRGKLDPGKIADSNAAAGSCWSSPCANTLAHEVSDSADWSPGVRNLDLELQEFPTGAVTLHGKPEGPRLWLLGQLFYPPKTTGTYLKSN